MARVESVSLVDDLNGGEADETVVFSLDGREMEIDLSSAHAGELRDALAPYIGAARKATARRSYARVMSRPAGNREENSRIRAWAIEQGMKVSERGRIPREVLNAYANRSTAPAAAPPAPDEAEPAPTAPGAEKPKRRSRKKTTDAA